MQSITGKMPASVSNMIFSMIPGMSDFVRLKEDPIALHIQLQEVSEKILFVLKADYEYGIRPNTTGDPTESTDTAES